MAGHIITAEEAHPYGKWRIQGNRQTLSVGAGQVTTLAIPDGALLLGVTTKVTTLVTASGGGVSYSVGDGTDVDRWGAGIAFALNTKSGPADYTLTTSVGQNVVAATEVTLTVNAGAFTAGVVEIVAWYFMCEAGA